MTDDFKQPRGHWHVSALAIAVALAFLAGVPLRAEPISSDRILSATSADTKKKYEEVEAAIKKFEQKDTPATLELLKTAAEKHPELPPARMMLARLLYSANQAPLGRATVEQAVNEDPNEPDAYVVLGDIAFQERRFTEAELLFRRAAELTASLADGSPRKRSYLIRSHAGSSAIAESRQKWEEAKKELEAWLKLDNQNAGAHFRMGRVLFGLKQHDRAYEELKVASASDANLPPPPITMGRLHEQDANRDEASKWMNQAIATAPKDLKTRLGVGQWLWETGQLDEARKHAEEAAKIDSNSLEAKLLCGMVARFRKDYTQAERWFELAHLQSPSNVNATNQLALVLVAQQDEGKRRRAMELAQLNVRQFPQNPEVAATLGWVFYQFRRLDQAAQALDVAAKRGSLSSDAAYYMAKISFDLGKANDAERLLKFALNAPGVFAHREDAKTMLDSMTKSLTSP